MGRKRNCSCSPSSPLGRHNNHLIYSKWNQLQWSASAFIQFAPRVPLDLSLVMDSACFFIIYILRYCLINSVIVWYSHYCLSDPCYIYSRYFDPHNNNYIASLLNKHQTTQNLHLLLYYYRIFDYHSSRKQDIQNPVTKRKKTTVDGKKTGPGGEVSRQEESSASDKIMGEVGERTWARRKIEALIWDLLSTYSKDKGNEKKGWVANERRTFKKVLKIVKRTSGQ